MKNYVEFYSIMVGASVVNMAEINAFLQLIIVILSIIYGIVKIIKDPNRKE